MDGPNEPDPGCLYCGGTGEYVSNNGLEKLRCSYQFLAESRYRSDYAESDRQHLAILRIVQVARARHDADQT